MVKSPHVVEYQVRQTDRGVDVAVGPTARSICKGLPTRSKAACERPAWCGVRKVSLISRHPATGKTRRFIPLE